MTESQVRVRPLSEGDADDVVRISNQGSSWKLTVEDFREWISRTREDELSLVGEIDGRVIGFAELERNLIDPPGWIGAYVKVDEVERRHGYGSEMWATLEGLVREREHGGVSSTVRDDDFPSRQWAERKGFALWAHRFEMLLDLSSVDLWALEGAVDKAHEQGVRFFSLASLPPDEGWNSAYELFKRLLMDAPDMANGEPPTREFFNHRFQDDPKVAPDGIFLVADGEEFIGLTISFIGDPEELYTWFTGVDPRYRGRGVARAFKALTVEYARARGVKRMRTHNLSINEPMLRVNREVGYESQPGMWLMRKPLT